MGVYVKRYFWLVNVLAVIACTVFSAKTVNHLVEARFLADPDKAPSPPSRPADEVANATVRIKAGAQLVERNMFCSDCKPALASVATEGTVMSADGVPITSLPLRLVATNVSTAAIDSFATIENTSSAKRGSYKIGGRIPDAGEVKHIRGKYVDFENSSSHRLERILLTLGPEPPTQPAAYVPPQPAANVPPIDEVSQMIESGVKQVSDTNFDIDRRLVEKVLENPAVVAQGARIVPSIRNGKPNGFKLYAIRPGSIYAKIGLVNGDTIHSINGFELTTMDKALEVYTKVRDANNLTVEAERRGKPVTFNYSFK
jgi:general secretion pathway protein C